MFGIVSAALVAGCSSGSSDAGALDWDSLPSSFATECSVWTNPDPDSFATNTPPPAEVQVRAATVEHTTGDRVMISLSFLAPPPPPPLQVPGVGSQTIAQPGSVDFSFAVYPSGMNGPSDYSLSFQRDTQNVWTVFRSRTLTPERAKSGFDLESVVGTVDSSRAIGNDLIAEVDLAQFPAVLREPVFAPDVQVSSKQAIPRDPYRLPIEGPNGGPPKTGPSNMGLFMFATQNCSATDSDIAMDGGAFTSTFATEPRSAAADPETFANPTKAGAYQFTTSDGNFTCGINLSGIAEGAGCHGPIPTDAACTVGGTSTGADCTPNTIFISATSKGIQQAERQRYASGSTATVLNNNETLRVGDYACVVRDDTVQCSDNAGSEFSVSPTSATVT